MTDRVESALTKSAEGGFGGAADDFAFSSGPHMPGQPGRAGDLQQPTFPVPAVQEVLDGLPGSVIFLMPLRGADGEVADFRIAAAAPDAVDIGARRGKELIGLSVRDTYPTVAGTELWQGYLQALDTGACYRGEPFEYEEVVAGIPRLSRFAVQASACQGGLIVSWVRLDSSEREKRRLAVMQRLGGMGWADWDLVRQKTTWSEEAYAVFGRDRSLGPMTLEELPASAVTEDVPAVSRIVQRVLGNGDPIDHTFRISSPAGEVRHVRIVAEAEVDVQGTPVEVHGFLQDLTAEKRAEQQLLEHERAVQAQRSLLEAERAVAARLQHALLPLTEQSLRLGGLTVDLAYQPLQDGLSVGGDWYSAIELPDGSVLLVVGDVAGHGLNAVATMAQLRFTAKGMAITGMPLAMILDRLNTLLLHSTERSSTATMIMARYEPATSLLTWVQAGHLPPLLLRQGQAQYLSKPEGVLLGAVPDQRYAASTIHLQAGDQLLLYTDGLVEKPGEDLGDGLARLARSAAACGDSPSPLHDILDLLVDPDARRDDMCILHISL
ncbi:PP2C family protein-serine/threonine phosphatase [Streptomyces sp. NPDC088762]|uniref:PP2C family protein-serine/threonine phosphatase n=1 Tax=Streptomyces sp. NPDC088762 TaxID=3365891 RepID=UPI00381595A6